ncbi:MAG: PAS domain S-box protein [Deltaproteobacteria bacterium]|nr:PAS domain S-box protein [Deltaproteobacteria bacterium]
MTKPELKIPQQELSGRLQSLMLLRVLFISLLLGASIFIQVRETKTYFGQIQACHYLIIAGIYFLTFIYAAIYKYSKNLFLFAYFQLLLDTLIATVIIYATGGIESIFSFLYILTIINSSIILYRRGGFIIASISSILYGLLLDLHFYDIIQPLGSQVTYGTQYHGPYLLYQILVNIAGFYLVAYLISYLSEQTRRSRVELKAKQVDIDKLEILNESIINSMTSGLIVLDDGNRIIVLNPAAEEIFGIKADHASGQEIDNVLPFLKLHLPNMQLQAMREEEEIPHFLDLPYSGPGGRHMHLRFFVSPLFIPQGPQRGCILVFQDMTVIKRIEEELKKVEGLALIGELAAAIAHEIRNPMASISGSIQILKEGLEKDDVNSRLMDIISREIDRLNHLVNDFLLFTRPKMANLESFDLTPLILESLELFKNSRHWTGRTEIHTDFRDPIRLKSDPAQIKQVLWNLFLNACEAMPEGGALWVETLVEQDRLGKGDRTAKIVVRDTGKGFDESSLPQLYHPFFTTKEGGSGLGLTIVKRIVEGLQGEVSGTNHPEGGAQVSIRIPVTPPQKPPSLEG